MSCTRKQIVALAQSWVGLKESDGSHNKIIDIYNTMNPLPRGYKLKPTDAWCAGTTSALAIKCKATDIIPVECSCSKLIELAKKMGIWVEADNYVPKPADFVLYDWGDNAKGDNTGAPDHIGIVEEISGDAIIVIEGNYSNAVKRRIIEVNGKYIRGYIVPKYDVEPMISVMEWQLAAIADGFRFPKYGADGEWGDECASVARKAIVKRRLIYRYKNLTRLVQKAVGVAVDGKCGKETKAAIIDLQNERGLEPDGEVGLYTWMEILGIPNITKEEK